QPNPYAEIPPELQNQDIGAPPITSDPPVHTWARHLLLPVFSATYVAKYEPETRELCRSLIDGFIASGTADAAADYAQQIPPRVIASMLGIPTEEADTFTTWVRGFLEQGLTNAEIRGESGTKMFMYLWEKMQEHKTNPGRDDLITYLLNAEVDGKPVP